jgi:hypothetical protein
MPGRIASFSLFLLGMLIMALSNFTTFFHITSVDNFLAAGLGAFGLILCILAGFVLLPVDADDTAPMIRRLYSFVLFLAGLFHMTLGIFTIYFAITNVDHATAIGALAGGLILCLIGVAMLPPDLVLAEES